MCVLNVLFRQCNSRARNHKHAVELLWNSIKFSAKLPFLETVKPFQTNQHQGWPRNGWNWELGSSGTLDSMLLMRQKESTTRAMF